MIKSYIQRGMAILLALSLAAMTACSGKPTTPQSSQGTDKVAMGRYVEQPYELPKDAMALHALSRNADGVMEMVAFVGENQGDWLRYTNSGDGWTASEQKIMELAKLTDLDAATVMPNGNLLLAGRFFSDEFNAKMAELSDGTGYFDDDDLIWPKEQFVEIAADGTTREIPIVLPEKAANNTSKILVAESGDVFAMGYSEVYQFDGVTGELKNTFVTDSRTESIAVSGNRLAAIDSGVVIIFDMDSGERLETVEDIGVTVLQGDVNVATSGQDYTDGVVAAGEDGAFYFCNNTGIYRKTVDGGVVERILDGGLVTLGTPSVGLVDMVITSNGMLVLMRGSDSKPIAKEYVFDPTVPTLPDKELRVYSLKDNKTMRQAMSVYQLAHPDTHVVMELPADGVTQSDALRALSTQLLAGKGPDLLLLDGMPVESYMEKKVLLPMDETVTEGLLPNLVTASRGQDGKLYALPARFAIPMMVGDSKGISSVTDMNSLAGLITKLSAANPSCVSPIQNCGGAVLLNTLYPVFEDTLYVEGKLDEAKVRDFLTACKSVTDIQQAEDAFVTDSTADAITDITWNSVNLRWGQDLMGLGHVKTVLSFACAASATEDVADSDVMPLSPEGSHLFVPAVIMGVNSASGNKEAAQELVRLAVSPEVQGYEFDDGLPVNISAIDKLLEPRSAEKSSMMTFGGGDEEGNTLIANVQFPAPEVVAKLRGWIDELDTASTVDSVVLELLRNETIGYFDGSVTLDEAVSSLMQKLTLMAAE